MSAMPRGDEGRAPGPLRLAAARSEAPRDSIPAWLDVLVKLLRLPEAERASVREELETHLSERVRDLMVTGLSEAEASGRAIAELGDMAGLAQRFNRAARPVARRRLMNLGMLAAAGIGLVAGTVALTGPREDRVAVAVFAPEVTKEAAQAAGGKFDVPPDANWDRFFEEAGKAAGLPVVVNWGQLSTIADGGQFDRNGRAGLTGSGLTLPEACALINETVGADNGLAYRAEGGRLEIASVAYFDKREMVLATYDLAGIVEARLRDADPTARQMVTQQVSEQVAILIRQLVHPELWTENGGDRANLAVFGTKLFITAPKRMHPKIRWVLSELPAVEGAGLAEGDVGSARRSAKRPGAVTMTPESFDRRMAALAARLSAARDESEQLNAARRQGSVNSSEASRRQAELMEEEADVLDRMAELETMRPDAPGRPAGGADVQPESRSEGKAGGSASLDTAVFRPARMGPAAMRDVLSVALNRVPELQRAPARVLAVDESEGVLKVTAPVGQLEKIGRIIRAMDLPGPAESGDPLVTTSFPLRSWNSATVSELIGLAYHMRPGMETGFMGHSVLTDAARNAVIVSSRAGHVEFIQKFISALDGE